MFNWIKKILPGRQLPAGDPSPFVLWKWMPIVGPSHHNGQHEELYLLRLYIFRCRWFGLMLHYIVREDWDRDAQHDHPWTFFRMILSGGYTESLAWAESDTELGAPVERTYKRGYVGKFPTGAFHRITSVKPGTVSLCLNGPKNNGWGFFVPGTGKVDWRDYINGAR